MLSGAEFSRSLWRAHKHISGANISVAYTAGKIMSRTPSVVVMITALLGENNNNKLLLRQKHENRWIK
jgi:hypothetical protein